MEKIIEFFFRWFKFDTRNRHSSLGLEKLTIFISTSQGYLHLPSTLTFKNSRMSRRTKSYTPDVNHEARTSTGIIIQSKPNRRERERGKSEDRWLKVSVEKLLSIKLLQHAAWFIINCIQRSWFDAGKYKA